MGPFGCGWACGCLRGVGDQLAEKDDGWVVDFAVGNPFLVGASVEVVGEGAHLCGELFGPDHRLSRGGDSAVMFLADPVEPDCY